MAKDWFAAADRWLKNYKEEQQKARMKRRADLEEANREEEELRAAEDRARRYFGESRKRVGVLNEKDYKNYIQSIGGEAPLWSQLVQDYYAGEPVAVKYSDLDFFYDMVNSVDNDDDSVPGTEAIRKELLY